MVYDSILYICLLLYINYAFNMSVRTLRVRKPKCSEQFCAKIAAQLKLRSVRGERSRCSETASTTGITHTEHFVVNKVVLQQV